MKRNFYISSTSSIYFNRHWQDQGFLIIYVTARPDMQHRKVVSWLAMHNFPHGMVAFMEGIMKDPLRQKLNYLKGLQTDVCITIKYCIRIKYTTSVV